MTFSRTDFSSDARGVQLHPPRPPPRSCQRSRSRLRYQSSPNIPKSCVVVSATLSTGQQNTFGGTDRWQATAKQKQMRKGAPPHQSQPPPHFFSPEIVYILQQMKTARCAGGAETPHLAGLAAQGFACPGAQGRVRVNQKVLRVLAQWPLTSRSGMRACEQRRRSKTQHRAAKSAPANPRRGPASSPVSKEDPVSLSSLDWGYWCPRSIRACSGSFDRCCRRVWALGRGWGLQGQAGRGSAWDGGGGTGTVSVWPFSAVFARRGAHLVP